MHKRYCLLILLLFLSLYGYASIPPVDTIALWKGENIRFGKEVSLYAYKPEQPNGISIIVCPGGSYYWHDKENEGELVAEWLRSKGITAFVLTYRVAGAAEIAFHTRLIFRGKRHPDMITDAQRALQYVQEHAPEYQLDSTRIGMMGFSAGGHLVMSAACFSSTNFLQLSGIETNVNLRPAFVAAVYPVVTMHPPYVHKRSRRGLLGDSWVGRKSMRDSLSLERHIPDNCPPVFLINCVDDPIVQYQNSVLLDSALTQKGVPHEYLQYQEGKHGFGASDYYGSQECREWRNEFLRWLEAIYPCSL
ncbi:MAG: alpha/beta hydrolase [Bacteroidales bacterium]|nr:alpha/beta hydrolase [Bacteroidales bacterium]